MTELVEKRTEYSKTFELVDGPNGEKNFRISSSVNPLHFLNKSNDWEEVDLTLVDNGTFYTLDKVSYSLRIEKNFIGFTYTASNDTSVSFTLLEINSTPVMGVGSATIDLGSDRLKYVGTVLGLNFILQFTSSKIELWKLIQNDTAPKNWEWLIEIDPGFPDNIELDGVRGRDSAGALNFPSDINHPVELIKTTTDNGIIAGKINKTFKEEFTGRVSVIDDPKLRTYKWVNINISHYPVLIDVIISKTISAGIDDVYEYNDASVVEYNSYIYMGYDYVNKNGGFRFRDLAIPPAAIINSADLRIFREGINGTPAGKWYADDVIDANLWSDSDRPSQISKTTANVALNTGSGNGFVTQDMTSIIQELVNIPTWSGDPTDMRFGMISTVLATNILKVRSHDHYASPTGAADITIDYTVSTPDRPQGFDSKRERARRKGFH